MLGWVGGWCDQGIVLWAWQQRGSSGPEREDGEGLRCGEVMVEAGGAGTHRDDTHRRGSIT